VSDSLGERVAWARKQREAHGEWLLGDERVRELLARVSESVESVNREMARVGLVEICRVCDEEEGGSCCGAGIENRYDGVLLLINLLLGATLPAKRTEPSSCLFLGEGGCLLPARHVLCVNYACEKVTREIPAAELAALREREGPALEALFLLHDCITRLLREV
jgi:hypothetical protein